ncbi:MAG TPA: tetratricopeptide repeat protein [Vicinamibacterales bacterium]|nr:tetratricopeptide repeat protein [Vicinamibacterales bacterium]
MGRKTGKVARSRSVARVAKPRSHAAFSAALVAAVFVVKLAVMLQLKDHPLTQPDAGLDTTAYATLASRVLGGDLALGPGLYFVSPLYIYFLAAALAVARSFTAVRLIQIALGAAAVGLIQIAANEWFGRRAAWLAAGLAALTGVFTFYESLLLQAALDPFLTAAALACLALALRRGCRRWYLLAGLAFGIQVLNRPNIVIPAAAIVVLLAAARRWRAALVFGAGLALAFAPMTFRNLAVADEWSPLPSQGGLNFYIGNNPNADGTYRMAAGITPNIEGQQEDARRVAERATGRALDDAAVSQYFYGLGWTWIRERPWSAAKLFAWKLSLVFSAADPWLNYSYKFFADDAHTLLGVLFVGPPVLVPLGVIGLLAARPRPWRTDYLIWVSFMPIYALAVAMFFVADRYRLPLLIPLCAGAGAALDACASAVAAHRWRTLAVTSTAFLLFALWVNRPLHLDNGLGEERTRMAERLITLGLYNEAELWASRAEQASERPGIVHFRVGQRLLMREQPSAAIAHFERALQFDPGQPEVEFMLGDALVDGGRPHDAIPHLRKAAASGTRADLAGYDLVRALGATGDRDEAIGVLQGLHPSQDGDADRWVALGELAMQLRDAALAEPFFRHAVAARPDSAAARANLAAALVTLGRLSEARLQAQEAARLDPSDERAKQVMQMLR